MPDRDGSWQTWKAPGNNPQIYAVYVDNKDIVWLSDFAANATLRFDPKTEQFTGYKSSSRNASVRQILGRQVRCGCRNRGLISWW